MESVSLPFSWDYSFNVNADTWQLNAIVSSSPSLWETKVSGAGESTAGATAALYSRQGLEGIEKDSAPEELSPFEG